jgi:hypothetical protein
MAFRMSGSFLGGRISICRILCQRKETPLIDSEVGRFTRGTWSPGVSRACTRSRKVCAARMCALCSTLCVSRSPAYSPSWLNRWKPTRRQAPDRWPVR